MTSLTLTRTLSGFALANDESIHAARKLKLGESIVVEVQSKRRNVNLRRWWALCNLIYENSEQYKSSEQVHDHLKILAGHCTPIVNQKTGEVWQIPDSISFSRLTEEEFQDVWQRVIKAVCEDIIPGLKQNDLTNEIMKIVGIAG